MLKALYNKNVLNKHKIQIKCRTHFKEHVIKCITTFHIFPGEECWRENQVIVLHYNITALFDEFKKTMEKFCTCPNKVIIDKIYIPGR